jgi:TolA-binding protein
MLRQGECFEALGRKDDAKLFYEDVIARYPKSKAAKDARTRLGK